MSQGRVARQGEHLLPLDAVLGRLNIWAALLALAFIFVTPSGDAWAGKKKRARKDAVKSDYYRCRHEVLPGETLGEIAKRYRITTKRLRAVNRLKSSRLKAGRKLGIVTRYPCRVRRKVKHTVRKGDSLSKVARKYKMELSLLRRLNRSSRKGLQPGQRLTVVVEGPEPGKRVAGMHRLITGPGYKVRNPKRSWGTFLSVNTMIDVFTEHHRKYPDGHIIRVDDVSRKGGGYLKPHKSHRTGRDVDIRYPLKVATDQYVKATASNIDLKRSWDLVHGFMRTGQIVYIFMDYKLQKLFYEQAKKEKVPAAKLKEWFQYPKGRKVLRGIIRHEPGHATHLHVRFKRELKKDKPSS